mmetsp:Transcript_28580/g.58068  ORF Transcript_28580/g.58068 Transcript_28580/m.58068 type:complete len:815 (+) Transcript_28580:1681-4125(+)
MCAGNFRPTAAAAAASATMISANTVVDSLESLDELHDVASYYQCQLTLLNSEIQSSCEDHDEFVGVVRQDVMNKVAEVASMKEDLKQLDEELQTCRDNFGGLRLPKIKRLSSASKNIQRTIDCLEQIASIRDGTVRIKIDLGNDLRPISDICHEVLKLESFALSLVRGSLDNGIMDGRSKHKMRPQSQPEVNYHYQCPLANEFELLSDMHAHAITGQVEAILEVSNQVRDKVRDIISQCIHHGCNNTQLLEQAIEALVLIDDSDSSYCDVFDSAGRETFQQLSLRTVYEAVCQRVHEVFTCHIYNRADAGDSGVGIVLGAASRALSDLILLQQEMAPYFPPGFDLGSIFQDQCEQYIYPQINALHSQSLRTLEVRDILALVVWISEYTDQLYCLNPTAQLSQDVQDSLGTLLEEYRDRIKSQTMDWLHNIRGRERSFHPDHNGNLITHDPEDMLNILSMHQSVADEFLSSTPYSSMAAHVYLDALEVSLAETQKEIDKGVSCGLEFLVSTANDCMRLSWSIEGMGVADEDDDVSASIERVSHRCEDIAHCATKRISDCIMLDVEEEYLAKIGTKEWENGSELVVVVVQTLQDYFADLKVWLPELFSTKLIRRSLDLVLNAYIEAFYSNLGGKRTRFSSCIQASRVLARDNQLLSKCFANIAASVVQSSGLDEFVQDLDGRLYLLKCMSTLLSSDVPEAAENAIEALLLEFGSQAGLDAVMNLVSLVGSFDSDCAAVWLSMVAKVQEQNRVQTNDGTPCVTPERNRRDDNVGSGCGRTCTSRKRHCAGNWTVSRQAPRRMSRWRRGISARRRLSF